MAPKAKPKPAATPPPSSAPPAALEDLFSTLNRHINNSEFRQAIKVADQILTAAPRDEDALRCKVVALIKLDNVDVALSTIRECEKLGIDLQFHKAYCLYRQNKLQEALDCLRLQEKNPSVLQLEAQIFYRLGKMDACTQSYDKLRKFKVDSSDVYVNIIAALIAAGRASEVQSMMDTLKVTANSRFEMAYNAACSMIEKKKYSDAEKLLLSARRIGQEMLMEDDCTEEEIENELAPIAVQLAYVQQMLGRSEEAAATYANLMKRNVADASSLAVATNNLISLKGTRDVSDGLKKLDRLIEKIDGRFQIAQGLDLKLFSRQKEAIYTNRMLLLLHANKMDQARELAAALPSMFPDSVMPALLEASVLVRENKAGQAEELLKQFAERHTDKAKTALLARAQVAVAAGHHAIAAESLAQITDIQHLPATVATLVCLRERAGDVESAAATLDSALQWWSNSMDGESRRDVIMQEAAAFKLKHGKAEEAARLFEDLVKNSQSITALVGLVTTMARVDVNKAEMYEKRLPPLPGLKDINVKSLEQTPGAGQTKHVDMYMEGVEEEAKGKSKTKKKRKRKPKYPKGFDPANPGPPPDPERWLPKRERSSYRPRRKDKRAAQIRGSQGAVAREKLADASTSTSTSSKSAQASGTSKVAANTEQSKSKPSKSRKKSRN
ncbi:uncharacterized protein LOC116248184 [Nymphaea colorata]|nr:uncharacterized protein LOC116248184 [Nymphaea colorata]